MPCDKTTEGLEGTIGFWDFLMGNISPFDDDRDDSLVLGSEGTPAKEVWYNYRYNPITRDVEYQFPPSEKWGSYP